MYKAVFFCLILSLSAFAKKKAEITVELTPAGSFSIMTKKIKGSVKKKGADFYAKNIKVPVKFLNSDIDLRDKHIKEKLESKKHKFIVLTKAIGKGGKGKGVLKVRNVSQKINFTYEPKGKEVEVKFSFSLKKFKFPEFTYMGIGVKDKISVVATLPLKGK